MVPPLFVNRHKITGTHEHGAFVFAAKALSNEIKPQAAEDIKMSARCIWVTRDELQQLKEWDERLGHDTYRYALAAQNLINKK